jgi:hypothetical protein
LSGEVEVGRRDWILDAAGVGTMWSGTYKGQHFDVWLEHQSGVLWGGYWWVKAAINVKTIYRRVFEWNTTKGHQRAFEAARKLFDEWVVYVKENP